MMAIGRATVDDLGVVLGVLNEAAAWLHGRGLDQWPDGFGAARIGPYIARGEVWLVRDDDGRAVATVRLTAEADPAFWTAAERAELALYMSNLAIVRTRAGAGLGALVLRWAGDYAARLGYAWVRADAWRTNARLHAYYRGHGWEHLRTVTVPGRRSGALFQRPVGSDLQARAAFAPPRPPGGWLAPGDRVTVCGHSIGTVASVSAPGAAYGVVPGHGDQGVLAVLPGYRVRLDDGREIWAARSDVTGLGTD